MLIPQGARLIGTYDSATSYGDDRVFLVWNRLLMPNGWSIQLGAMEAADPAGAAGLKDKVDNHLGRLAGAIGVSAVLSVLANEAQNDNELGFRQSVGDAAAQAAARVGGRPPARSAPHAARAPRRPRARAGHARHPIEAVQGVRRMAEELMAKWQADELLTREEASAYLASLGVRRKPATLAKLFCTRSDGPPCVHDGRKPYYPKPLLREWGLRQLTELRRSSSERV